MDFKLGAVAISRAGHDKGDRLAVVRLEGGYALVCDGKSRPLSKPKLKNLRHLAATGAVIELPDTDKKLRKLLREHPIDQED